MGEREDVHSRVRTQASSSTVVVQILGSLKPDSNFTLLNTRFYGKNGYFLPDTANIFYFYIGLT